MESHPLEKNIYLTFDDGPNEPYTSQVLDILSAKGAKATFFVCGKNIEQNPESIKKIVEAGHAIGAHSYSHNPWKVIAGNLFDETEYTRELIKKYTGVDTRIYRSPWGITMPWLNRKLKQNGYSVFHWNIMSFDWWQPSAEYIADHTLKRIFSDAIILLHDGDQTQNGSRNNTIKALPVILTELSAKNYKFKLLEAGQNCPTGSFTNIFIDILIGGVRFLKYWIVS